MERTKSTSCLKGEADKIVSCETDEVNEMLSCEAPGEADEVLTPGVKDKANEISLLKPRAKASMKAVN